MRTVSIAFAPFFAFLVFLASCGSAQEPTWSIAHQEPSATLLSVWGSGPSDVWAVGGRDDAGLVLHNDGAGWQPINTGADRLLWWVYGFSANDVYAVGEGGLILHYDGANWSQVASGTNQTLYGVWGASGEDVWIVGGSPDVEGAAVVLRGNANGFAPSPLPEDLRPSALFKVYGGPQGIVAVGTSGTVLRMTDSEWHREVAPTDESIFSLWGRGDTDMYAVGGYASGEVLHYDGRGWTRIADVMGYGLSGVFTAEGEPTIAVGPEAYVVEIDDTGSIAEPLLPTEGAIPSLHGVWGDGVGTTYAVGGEMYPGLRSGVIYKRQ